MFKDCLPGKFTEVVGATLGQSCAVVVSQPDGDPGGWWLYLQARTREGVFNVERAVLTPTFRGRTRVVAVGTLPGADVWTVLVQPPAGGRMIRVATIVSETPFTPPESHGDGQPGSKGWSYAVTTTVNVPPGARLREVSAVAGGSGGTVQFTVPRDATTNETLAAVPLPANLPYALPRDSLAGLVGPVQIVWTGTITQQVVWVE